MTDISPNLSESINRFMTFYRGDGDLVRPGAAKHQVEVRERGIFDPVMTGHYNFGLPKSDDAVRLTQAHRVVIACEDYRQVSQVAQALQLDNTDAFITVAGGAAQPDQARFEAMVELLSAIYQANPIADFILVAHNEVCGGANHFTQGQMAQIRQEQDGEKLESEKMAEYVRQLKKALLAKGVNQNKVSLLMAKVTPDNRFETLISIT
jgi:hypothetical protein